MQMPETTDGTRDKILQVTIGLLRSCGHDDELTVRKIARQAGVNVGAVNYYFGSKDDLIDAAVKSIMQRVMDSIEILDDKSTPPIERLNRFLVQVTGVFLSCHVSPILQMFRKRNQSFKGKQEFINYFREMGFEKIKNTIMEITGDPDDAHAYLLFLQIMAAIVMPNVLMAHAPKLPKIPLPGIEEQVEQFLARIFYENCGGSR